MSHVSTWMGDRLGIHGAVDIFPQMKQAYLLIRFQQLGELEIYFFIHIDRPPRGQPKDKLIVSL